MFVSFALQIDMESMEAKLAKLNSEVEDVKKQIKDIQELPTMSEKLPWKDVLHDYLEKEKRLSEEIKALEGSL